MAAGRPEYRDHAPVIEEFRREADRGADGPTDRDKKP
jgi:hypothetical protein